MRPLFFAFKETKTRQKATKKGNKLTEKSRINPALFLFGSVHVSYTFFANYRFFNVRKYDSACTINAFIMRFFNVCKTQQNGLKF